MLSWDDYQDDTPAMAPATPKPQAAAPAPALAVREPAPQAAAPAARPAAPVSDAVARAQQAIADLDPTPGLEELEMGAARVAVDEKRMINCRADVNQLVPFKYDWAWQ